MKFLTGVNYWASNAGLYTWRNFDEQVIDKDFEFLSSFGIDTIRVFPSWDVFQPIEDVCVATAFTYRVNDVPVEYTEFPDSGLSLSAISNFKTLLDLAKKHNLKVIVALITGWMSGRKFMPRAISHLNPITDAKAVNFECRFIKDFINETKGYEQIIAWELGNECNAMSLESDENLNELWLSAVSSTIKKADPTRPLYAGMHGLTANGKWKLQTLGYYTDVQTTHPYPLFTPYCSKDELTAMRSVLHASAESSYYASISKKPCLVEEAGSLGPMIVNEEKEAEHLEKAYATSFASGTTGFLWWCAFDQDKFDFPPYDVIALEQNLGIAKDNKTPKLALLKMKELSQFTKAVGDLDKPNVDATVILTNSQDEWKTAYGAYVLGVQAGLTVDFIYENQPLPDRDNYILPCISEINGIPKRLLDALIEKVDNGANLLITYNGGYIGKFENVTGLEVLGRNEMPTVKKFDGGEILSNYNLELKPTTAKVEIYAEDGSVLLSKNQFGKGNVYFLNAPLEYAYTGSFNPENTNLYTFYKQTIKTKNTLDFNDAKLAVYRYGKTKAMLINFSNKSEFTLSNVKIKKVINGTFNSGVLTLTKPYAYIEYED